MKWFRGANRASTGLVGAQQETMGGDSALKIWESPLTAAKYFIVDIETSGFSAETDVILSLAAACMNGVENHFSAFHYDLIRNDNLQSVPSEIWELTGLSPELIRNGQELRDVLSHALLMAVDCVWVAHHARHELSFLQRHARQIWKMKLRPIVIDTAVVAQALGRLSRPPTLDEVCRWLNVPVHNRHQADSDVRMTAEVWRREMQLCDTIGLKTVADVIDWASSRALG